MSRNATQYVIGIDEAGRPRGGRASPRSHKYIIGIDEAGRGPLAGPVVVAGIKVNQKFYPEQSRRTKFWKGIRDSKKLTAKQREEWFKILTNHSSIGWVVSKISPGVIDQINIARAANLGALRVYKKLTYGGGKKMLQLIRGRVLVATLRCRTLLDGSLYLPRTISHETIIKGDEKVPVISAASIIAKVTRDRLMRRLHKKYPQYRFDLHKGYGTRLHRDMVKKFGKSEVHRKSFRA